MGHSMDWLGGVSGEEFIDVQRKSKREIVEKFLFGIFNAMVDKSTSSPWISHISLLIEFLQLAAFSFHSGITWGPAFTVSLEQLFYFIDLAPLVSYTAYQAVFCIAVTGLLLAIGDAAYVGYQFHKERYTVIWPIHLLRWVVSFALTTLYIPLVLLFLIPMSCTTLNDGQSVLSLYQAVPCWSTWAVVFRFLSVAFLLIFAVWTATFQLVYFQSDPAHPGLLSRPNGRIELVIHFAKTILSICFAEFAAKQLGLVNLLCCLLMTLLTVIFLPYYRLRANRLRVMSFMGCTWLALCQCAVTLGTLANDTIFIIAMCGLPVFLAFGFGAVQLRFVLLMKRHKRSAALLDGTTTQTEDVVVVTAKFRLVSEVEMATRSYLQGDKPDILAAQSIFKQGLAQFPSNALLHVEYVNFVCSYLHNEQLGQVILDKTKSMPSLPDVRFLIYRKDAHFANNRRSGAVTKGALDLMSYVEFDKNYKAARQFHRAAIREIKRFWRLLLQSDAEFMAMASEIASRIDTAEKKAKLHYLSLVKKHPDSVKLIRCYGEFLQDVSNNPAAADMCFRRADTLEDQNQAVDQEDQGPETTTPEHTVTSYTTVNERTDGIVTIDAHGVIQTINSNAETLLGYKRKELVGKNVRVIMPSPYAENHQQYLESYIQTGKAKIVGKGARDLEAKRKNGTLVPISLSITRVGVGGEVAFAAIIRERDDSAAVFHVSTTGLIVNVNKRATEMFGYSTSEFLNKNISTICPPGIAEHHDDFLKAYQSTGVAKVINTQRNLRGRHKSGRLFPISMLIREGTVDGEQVYIGRIIKLENIFAYLTTDFEGAIIAASEITSALVGYEKEHLVGMNITAFLDCGSQDATEFLRTGVTGDGPAKALTVTHKDGSVIAVDVELNKTFDQDHRYSIKIVPRWADTSFSPTFDIAAGTGVSSFGAGGGLATAVGSAFGGAGFGGGGVLSLAKPHGRAAGAAPSVSSRALSETRSVETSPLTRRGRKSLRAMKRHRKRVYKQQTMRSARNVLGRGMTMMVAALIGMCTILFIATTAMTVALQELPLRVATAGERIGYSAQVVTAVQRVLLAMVAHSTEAQGNLLLPLLRTEALEFVAAATVDGAWSNQAYLDAATADVATNSDSLDEMNHELVQGSAELGLSSLTSMISSSAQAAFTLQTPSIPLTFYDAAAPYVQTYTLWDAIHVYVDAASSVASATFNSTNMASILFVLTNGPANLQTALLNSLSLEYNSANEAMGHFSWAIIGLTMFGVVMLVVLVFCVFRPASRRMSRERQEAQQLLLTIPKPIVLALSKKLKDDASESEESEAEEQPRDEAAPHEDAVEMDELTSTVNTAPRSKMGVSFADMAPTGGCPVVGSLGDGTWTLPRGHPPAAASTQQGEGEVKVRTASKLDDSHGSDDFEQNTTHLRHRGTDAPARKRTPTPPPREAPSSSSDSKNDGPSARLPRSSSIPLLSRSPSAGRLPRVASAGRLPRVPSASELSKRVQAGCFSCCRRNNRVAPMPGPQASANAAAAGPAVNIMKGRSVKGRLAVIVMGLVLSTSLFYLTTPSAVTSNSSIVQLAAMRLYHADTLRVAAVGQLLATYPPALSSTIQLGVGGVYNTSTMRALLLDGAESMNEVQRQLLYSTPGAGQSAAPDQPILNAPGCLRLDRADCRPPDDQLYAIANNGLDQMYRIFEQRVNGWARAATADVLPTSPLLQSIFSLGPSDLRDGLTLSLTQYVTTLMASRLVVPIMLFVAQVIALLGIHFIFMRPMMRGISQETQRTRFMLLMIPPDVCDQVEEIRRYLEDNEI